MPAKIPNQLREVAEHVTQGSERSASVRTLLSWFEAERRDRPRNSIGPLDSAFGFLLLSTSTCAI